MTGRWLDQVQSLARERLPEPVFRYVEEGARDEVTTREAVAAWRSLRVAPHVLRDVREVDTSCTLLGDPFAMPVGIAPMTLQRAADPDGEVAMARAAAAVDVPLVISSNAGSTFADIAATGVAWWLQVYVPANRSDTEALLRQAVDDGARGIVLTADTPVVGTRYASPGAPPVWDVAEPGWVGANAPTTIGTRPDDREKAMDLGPADLEWLAATTGRPVVVKGVLRADDARRCVDAGAAAVWVSNHGGRQLDRVVATAHCVASVRDEVGHDAEVYVDGGIRSGLDVLLATSLGADAVFVGRPLFHALAAGGVQGAARALEELGGELSESLRLSGCATLAQTAGIACAHRGFGPLDASDLREPGV